MRQITLQECQVISGGVNPALPIAGAVVLGALAANLFTPSYPILAPILATLGGGNAGAGITHFYFKGFETVGMVVGSLFGLYSSAQAPTSYSNHLAAVIGGGATAGALAYFA